MKTPLTTEVETAYERVCVRFTFGKRSAGVLALKEEEWLPLQAVLKEAYEYREGKVVEEKEEKGVA